MGNEPRRRKERQEKPKKSLRGLRFFAVQIHDPATALNRETTVKRRAQKRTSGYKPAFTAAQHKLMKDYRVGDLLDEIWLNHLMLQRTTVKRNSADG